MKRFLKVFVLLIVSLFVLVSGLDRALDNFSRANTQSSYTWYSEKGDVVLAFNGDLNGLHTGVKSAPIAAPTFLHRG